MKKARQLFNFFVRCFPPGSVLPSSTVQLLATALSAPAAAFRLDHASVGNGTRINYSGNL